MVIDSHAHVMEHLSGMGARGEVRPIGKGKVRFLDGTEQQVMPEEYGNREFVVETLVKLMDEAGIDKAVLLHGLLYGLQNEYIYECVQKYPDRLIGSGSLDPCIEQADLVLERLIDHYGFKILKFELSTGAGMTGIHRNLKVNGEEFERIFQMAGKKRVVIVLDIGSRGMFSYQIDEIVNVAEKYPDVKIVICHLLGIDGNNAELWKWDMQKLAVFPNVFFDITAIPWNVNESYPFHKSIELICEAKDIVGSARMMWGSDVPQLLVINSYKGLYDFMLGDKRILKMELEDLLYKTAINVYGIK